MSWNEDFILNIQFVDRSSHQHVNCATFQVGHGSFECFVSAFSCMGCRSFLSPWKDENGNYKFYGRFNQGVVTINLPDVALSSGGDFKKFWEIFDERLDLCYRALMLRHKRLEGTLSDAAPILWQYGALARLKKGETIDKLLALGVKPSSKV